MSIAKLLQPAGPLVKGPNAFRTLALGHFGEIAWALANGQNLPLTPPDTLSPNFIQEWWDAIAEEILLLAQADRDRAKEFSKSFVRSHPFRHGPGLEELIDRDAAVVVVPVDTGDPPRQGTWMHLWLIDDPHCQLAKDDRDRLQGTEMWSGSQQRKLFVVTTESIPFGLTGRSWQLGGFLAERALGSEYNAVDLAAGWIVTGEIGDGQRKGQVLPVRIGNKTNIPWKQTARSWLVPGANLDPKSEVYVGSDFRRQASDCLFGAATVEAAWSWISGEEPREDSWNEGSPYPGLVPYDVGENQGGELKADYSKVFFGRKEAIKGCWRKLTANRKCGFLLIAGASGSGKSSLARAGLAPWITGRPGAVKGTRKWRRAVFRPGSAPLIEMAEALLKAVPKLGEFRIENSGLNLTNPAEGWAYDVANNPEFAAVSLVQALDPGTRVLLVVDQLEDALPASVDSRATARSVGHSGEDSRADEAKTFAAVLSALCRSGSVWGVATLRADQMGRLIGCETLRKLTEDGATYNLGSPDATEIVRRPAKAARLEFESRDGTDLDDEIVQDFRVAEGSDALPLLQMTLRQLFEARDGDMLTFAAYERIGRLEGAISRHADSLLGVLEQAAVKEIPHLLLVLTDRNPDGSLLARRVLRTDFETSPARILLVEELVKARLLVADANGELRVAHEALLRQWGFAAKVLSDNQAVLKIRNSLKDRASGWRTGDIDSDLLLRGDLLKEAESVLEQLQELGEKKMVAFIEASVEKETRELRTNAGLLATALEKLTRHLEKPDFAAAVKELDNVARLSEKGTNTGLKLEDVQVARDRVVRLDRFSTAARDSERLSGEEDFKGALQNCENALKELAGGEDIVSAYRSLEAFGARAGDKNPQIEQLDLTAYRVRLLFCTLQLVPGLTTLFPRPAPGPPRPKRFVAAKKLGGKLLGLAPKWLVLLILRLCGSALLRLPRPQRNPKALREFDKCSEALAQVQEIEKRRTKEYRASRTSCLVGQIASVMRAFADGKIDYAQWLSVPAPAARPEPVSGVDYFFVALFNYFIAKRSEGLVGKILSWVQGLFPDLDARAPLITAERLLRSAVNLDRNNFWCHWLLGRTLLTAKNYGGAELAFNAAIALEPEYARGWEQLALALGHQYFQTRDNRVKARAEDASQKALRFAKGDPSIFWPRGELFEQLGKKGDAVDAYSRWLELEENLPDLISRSTGVDTLYNLAGELLGQAKLDSSARADAYALLALVYMTWAGWESVSPNRNQSEALNAAEAALKLNFNHLHARTVEGVVLRQRGKFKEAVASLKLALDQNPLAYRAALNLAVALEFSGQKEEALAAWGDLLKRSAGAQALNDEKVSDQALNFVKKSDKEEQVHELCPPWIIQRAQDALAKTSLRGEPA